MNVPITNTIPDAGSPANARFHRATGHPYVRPQGMASVQDFFSDNYSSLLGKHCKFNRCRNENCGIGCTRNDMILPLNNFHSSFNNNSFTIRTNEHLNCNSSNIIYLITCTVCGKQYVGETKRTFVERMKEHLRQIKKNNKAQIIYAHFNCDEKHRNTPVEKRIRFQIIEKVRVNAKENIESKEVVDRRLARELFWISKLRTAFPLGLNDRIQGDGLAGNATDKNFVAYNYFKYDRAEGKKNRKRKRGQTKRKKGGFVDQDFNLFAQELNELLKNASSKIEKTITAKQRNFLRKFQESTYFQKLDRKIKYVIERRTDFLKKDRPKKKNRDSQICKIDFTHKIIEDLNLPALFKTRAIADLLPPGVDRKSNIKIVYKYGKPVSSDVLNYNKTLRETEIGSFTEINSLQCDCDNSPFKDDFHGHIITGNLEIVQDPELRQLLAFGTKFREIPYLQVEKIMEGLKTNIETLVGSISRKFKTKKSLFTAWKDKLLEAIGNKINAIRFNTEYRKPILKKNSCKNELKRLQDKFVITVVDKAAGNYAFTCKKFYFSRLAKELGLDGDSLGNETYEHVEATEEEIVAKIQADLLKFGIKSEENGNRLALLYHNPKFHKNPTKFRFIAGNVGTAISTLDDMIAKVLKMCKKHFVNLQQKSGQYKGVRYIFDIENSLELKNLLDSYGENKKAVSISINDFSTLYTLFEHEHIKANMEWLIGLLQRNKKKEYIRIGYKVAYWTDSNEKDNTFSVAQILEMINYLIDNSYIKAFNLIFRQSKGIIMGGKISGWISDLSLMADEFKYIRKLEREGKNDLVEKFKGFCRYRDDCTVINIENFLEIAKEIYPPSLDLTQENTDLTKADVLDMKVVINEFSFLTSVYCKTDDFPFDVISLPFLEGNLSDRICYLVFFGQILRFCRLSTRLEDFIIRVKKLGTILLNRGYQMKLLKREFCRVIEKYRIEFQKWNIPIDCSRFFSDIFK